MRAFNYGVKRELMRAWLAFAATIGCLLILFSGRCVAAEESQVPLRVLMVFDEGPDLISLELIEENFEATLRAGNSRPIEFYHEYLDASRFREAHHHTLFADYLRVKYGEMNLDLIVPVVGTRMDWASRIPRELFPDVPVVFGSCMSNGEETIPLVSETTGVLFSIDVVKGLETALAVRPGTRRVVVVAGPEGMFPELITRIGGAAKRHPGVTFEYWTDRAAPDILGSAALLRSDALILYLEFFRDSEGASFVPWEFGESLARAASVPVFGIYESYLDTGVVGGAVVGFSSLGVEVGRQALRVLNGERASAIPVSMTSSAMPIFDWRAMQRWGIRATDLPAGSDIRFRPPSLWETHRTLLIAGIIYTTVLTLLLVGLTVQRAYRRRAERGLAEQEKRLRLAVELSGAGLWSLDLRTNQFWMTAETRSIFGFHPEEDISLKRLLEVVHPEDREALRSTIDEVVESGEAGRIEYRIEDPDGAVRWIVSRWRAYAQPGQPPKRLMGVSLDITESKMKSEMIREQKDFVDVLINSLPGVYYLYDEKWQLIRWNFNHQHLTGFSREEMFHRHVLDWFSPSHKDVVACAVQRVFEEGEATVEAPFLMKDGREVPYVFNGVRLDVHGKLYFLGMGIDISQRVQKETALRQSEKQLRLVADSLPALIAHVDAEQRYRFVNKSYAESFGLAPDEVVGKRLQDVMGDVAYGAVRESVEKVLSGLPVVFQPSIQHADSARQLLAMYVPELDGATVRGFFASIQDVTDLEQAKADALRSRDALAHVTRVSTMAELATSLAHELNQPLTAIMSNAQSGLKLLRANDPDMKEIEEILSDILADDKRAGDVIHRMRDFLRKDLPRRESLNINQVINGVLDILHSEVIIQGVLIKTDLVADLPCVQGDRVQLEQVLINLIINAEQAMNSIHADPCALTIKTSKDSDGNVVVCMQDSGPGIPEDMQERIFDPFLSRRANGMGMGLAISRSIVEATDGRIWAENAPGGGARFCIVLPGEDES